MKKLEPKNWYLRRIKCDIERDGHKCEKSKEIRRNRAQNKEGSRSITIGATSHRVALKRHEPRRKRNAHRGVPTMNKRYLAQEE